tara:strand:- start:8628 stop:9887 length:1260 start_codon:yes stop_codon:yes gene_type:complete
MLIANMGAGKTIISLTAIQELIDDGVLNKVLVIAPLKVCREVWRQEAQKWEHTTLNVTFCEGDKAQRTNTVLTFDKGIMLLNFENMQWFFTSFKNKFDGLLIDELSKLKAGGKGFKKMRPHIPSFKWVLGMTGTPVAEDFAGLFYQVMAIDNGDRFGRNKSKFLIKYFTPDYNDYDWTLREDGAENIVAALQDLVYTVPDYRHTLPPLTEKICYADMPAEALEIYNQFTKTAVLDIDPPQTADNAAVLSGKLQQLSSGELYCEDEFGERIENYELHTAKLEACKQLVESLDQPVIITYWYKHELARLQILYPDAPTLSDPDAIDQWNRGELPVLLVQPMSCSHGLQMQFGGPNLIFFAPVWSRDIREQMIARLWRKGQTQPVHVWEMVTRNTLDELMVDRVNGKAIFDKMFRQFMEVTK